MKNVEIPDDADQILEDTEVVRRNEAFLFKRATDDGDVSTFNGNKSERDTDDEAQTPISSKKQRVDKVDTNDEDMGTTTHDGKPIHTYEIILNDKEREILQLRQQLAALSASKEKILNDTNTNEKSGLKDGLPSNSIDVPPGPEEDPGEHL